MKKRKKKEEWVDDGRTIADMSGITRRNLLIPRPFPEELKEQDNAPENVPDTADTAPGTAYPPEGYIESMPGQEKGASPEGPGSVQETAGSQTPGPVIDENGLISDPEEISRRRPWEKSSLADRKETGWYILGTLSAGLLLVLTFIIAGGLIILLMLALWS